VREAGVTAPETVAEERLRIEAAQRDPARFAHLYEAHFDRVYAYAARRLRNRQEAEDLTAEVFHQALRNLGRFEWRGLPFAAWLFRIAANAIADRARRTARERAEPGPMPEPEPPFELVEDHARLCRLVRELPEDQRRVIEMRFTEERSIREVAAALGRSEGAVKQLQFRALRGLREGMGQANG
jgi:RNA polymerase sigma-70 factor (ECF subfamily)